MYTLRELTRAGAEPRTNSEELTDSSGQGVRDPDRLEELTPDDTHPPTA